MLLNIFVKLILVDVSQGKVATLVLFFSRKRKKKSVRKSSDGLNSAGKIRH